MLTAGPALAQYHPRPVDDSPLSERYRIEAAFGLWDPSPDMTLTSESLGIVGSNIDLSRDLGLQQTRFGELRLTAKAARKHKFRFQYIPLDYKQEATLARDIIFNGQRYRLGVPVISELDWRAFRYTYEYDFISMSRGFGGVLLDLKQTNVKATLRTPVLDEFTEIHAPVPSIGGIARVYVVPGISVTGEVSGIRIPHSQSYDFNGHYTDFEIYGTVNVTRNFGAQVGYRSFNVDATVDNDVGHFSVKGLFFGGVVRY
jgi:hypothetical protein